MARFVRTIALTSMAQLASRFFSLLALILVARALGPEGYGQYTLAYLLATTIIAWLNLGLPPTTVYYLANGEHARDQVMGNLTLLHMLAMALALGGGWLFIQHYADHVFPQTPRGYLILGLLSVPGIFTYRFLQSVLSGMQRFDLYNRGQLVGAGLRFLFLGGLVFVLKQGVTGALIAEALAWALGAAVLWRWSRALVPHWRVRWNPALFKGIARYGFYSYLGGLLAFLNARADVYLINLFQGPKAVGMYSVAVGLAERLWIISQTTSLVLFPRISASDNAQWKRRFTPLVARTVLLLVLVPALLLALLAQPILVLLYSEAYLPAVRPLQVLLLGIVVFSVSRILAHDLAGRGLPALNTYTSVFSLLINVALNLVLIPRWGIVGAAWASTVAYSGLLMSKMVFYRRVSGNTWRDVLWITREDVRLYRTTARTIVEYIKRHWRGVAS